MSGTWLWKVGRSIRVTSIMVFSNKSVLLENDKFMVKMVLLFHFSLNDLI